MSPRRPKAATGPAPTVAPVDSARLESIQSGALNAELDSGRQGGHAAPVASPASIPTQGLHMSSPREALELIARRSRRAVHANLVAILAEVDGGMH